MALQRNLKAPRNVRFSNDVRGNPCKSSIPRTLTYVRGNLARYGRFGRLRDLLAQHLGN